MKAFKAMMTVSLLLAALMIGGCTKKYYYDFAHEMDMGEAENAWVKHPTGDAYFSFDSTKGVRLNYGYDDPTSIRTPIYFSADFKVTVDFYLELDSSHISRMFFLLSDDTWPIPCNHMLYMPIFDICDSDEQFIVAEKRNLPFAISYFKDDNLPLISLNRNGANKLVIEKTGNQVKISFNGEATDTFGPYTLIFYTVDRFYLTIAADNDYSPDGTYGIYITRVEVEY